MLVGLKVAGAILPPLPLETENDFTFDWDYTSESMVYILCTRLYTESTDIHFFSISADPMSQQLSLDSKE